LIASYVLGSTFGIATIAAGLGQYLAYFGVGELCAVEFAIISVVLVVNLIGMTLSGATENALSLIKVVAIVAIIAVLMPSARVDNFAPFTLPSAPTLLSVAIIVYWPFTGFEISAIPVAETKDPRRIAQALLLVMVFVCAVYLALNVALIGAVGAADLAASPAPVAYAMDLVLPRSGPFVAGVGIVTMLSALNAYIVGASRVLQNGAEIFGVTSLARLSPRGVPDAALFVVCAGAAGMLLWSNRFDALAAAAVVTTLVPYVAICRAAAQRAQTKTVRVVAWTGALVTAAVLALYFVLQGE
jgi:amino acid transporter